MTVKKLSEVCDFQNGFAFKSSKFKSTGYPILRISNIQKNEISTKDLVFFDPSDYKENFERYKVVKDDILIAMSGGTTGKLGVNTTNDIYYLNQRVGKFSPRKDILRQYLYYFLQTKSEESLKIAGGAAQPNLSTEQIKNFEIPVPSISEQQQIVEKLDTAFDLIDRAKANIEKNIQNAKELFQSKLNQVFSTKGEGWEEKPLGEVCKTGSGGTPLKSHSEYYINGNIPWLVSGEVNNRTITHSKNFITQKGLDNSSARLFPKDSVLIAMYGATAGQVGILRFESASNQAVCAIFPNKNFSPDFLYYAFLFKKAELISKAVGNAQPNISQIKIKETIVPVIALNDQEKIVRQLDQLSAQTEFLQQKYQQKLANLEELRKSILEKAFKGELITKTI